MTVSVFRTGRTDIKLKISVLAHEKTAGINFRTKCECTDFIERQEAGWAMKYFPVIVRSGTSYLPKKQGTFKYVLWAYLREK